MLNNFRKSYITTARTLL